MSNISKELKLWDHRVFYKTSFKKNTEADLDSLKSEIDDALAEFKIIACSSEISVYKIGRKMIEWGKTNSQITFINSGILDNILSGDNPDWVKKQMIDDFFSTFESDLKNKWVVLPKTSASVSPFIAVYFISKVKNMSAIGIIIYGEGNDNIVENLALSANMPLFEFPEKKYRRRLKTLPEDGF